MRFAACAIPTRGARKLRSTSTASALMGEMYRTRQRCCFSVTGENMSRLMHQRKAARVLPVPVGARIKVDSPRAMGGQPCSCGLVGAAKTASNHSQTGCANRAASSFAEAFDERLSGSDIPVLYLDAGINEIVGKVGEDLRRRLLCVCSTE